MKTRAATLSQCTTLILMVADHQRTGKRIMGHPHKKHTQGHLTKDSISTAKEVA
jgi:hypothetical protein